MRDTPATRPNDVSLATGLGALLNEGGFVNGEIAIVEREPNVYSTSYASDVVRCRLPEGDELRLLCKYGSDEKLQSGHGAYGARGGVGYEVRMYREVLTRSLLPAPTFYGSRSYPERGQVSLVVEHRGPHTGLEPPGRSDAGGRTMARRISPRARRARP
jgi:hypothetical protein